MRIDQPEFQDRSEKAMTLAKLSSMAGNPIDLVTINRILSLQELYEKKGGKSTLSDTAFAVEEGDSIAHLMYAQLRAEDRFRQKEADRMVAQEAKKKSK